jgi:hypothetical protein
LLNVPAEREHGILASDEGLSDGQPPEIFGGASVVVRCR